ncbi:Hypothetical predicted protein [Paramuricea clavata]|uniref:Uncharacterized protein n=1 Tax=Paramuricea clavata TaxID=317549 RepID=A0A6S7IUA8_PARCT|nr:Hypothetical predicted protein [Paramuricea clavata]
MPVTSLQGINPNGRQNGAGLCCCDRRINPGINPNAGKVVRRKRKRQTGGSAHGQGLSNKDILINAAAGVLNKQKRRIQTGVKERKQNVAKPWVDMGKESGVQLTKKDRELALLHVEKNIKLKTIFL